MHMQWQLTLIFLVKKNRKFTYTLQYEIKNLKGMKFLFLVDKNLSVISQWRHFVCERVLYMFVDDTVYENNNIKHE